jgi:hypothetical protein
VKTTGTYYFPGMYTALLPMIPGIWAIVRAFQDRWSAGATRTNVEDHSVATHAS